VAGQPVDELTPVPETARVEDVVSVEKVEHALRMPAWARRSRISRSSRAD
jgi:hypothetical protein